MTALALALADPYGLGIDIALQGDITPVWGLVAGFTNLGYALARRLNAALGSLFYDLGYGFDVTDLLHQALTPADVARISQAIAAQCRLDERVQTCRVSLALVPQTGELTITIAGTIPQGVPFALVMAATALNVQLLTVNGQSVTTPANTNVATSTGSTTIIVQGGTTGPAGPVGPPGSTSLTFNLNPNGYADYSGAEFLVDEFSTNLGALASTVTFELVGDVMSQSGTAIFRLRMGGTKGVADGAVVATISTSSGTFVEQNGGSTQTNPLGLQRLKLTIQSSAPGQDAKMDAGATITIR